MTDAVLLSLTEVAQRLGRSRETVRQAVHDGQIPSIQLGKSHLVPSVALEEWLRTAGGWQAPEKPVSFAAERAKRRYTKRSTRQVARPSGPSRAEQVIGAQIRPVARASRNSQ